MGMTNKLRQCWAPVLYNDSVQLTLIRYGRRTGVHASMVGWFRRRRTFQRATSQQREVLSDEGSPCTYVRVQPKAG